MIRIARLQYIHLLFFELVYGCLYLLIEIILSKIKKEKKKLKNMFDIFVEFIFIICVSIFANVIGKGIQYNIGSIFIISQHKM